VAGTVSDSFDELYEGTRSSLLAYFLRRVDEPADAADLLSEVFLVAWRRRDELPEQAHLWLYGVARKVLAAHRRGRRVQYELATRLRAQVVQQYAMAEGDVYVRQVLSRLSARDRELMELVVYEQLTPVEIAVVLGQRAGTVRVRLHRARERLRGALADDVVPKSSLMVWD
jgi:RNA polymerase sigma-70 factor (ECF subfamily)